MYGAVAQSLASATTAGYYGTAEVPRTGSTSRSVYVVRTYILGLVLAILLAVRVLTTLNLLMYLRNHLPLRRITFLTVANAVRGPWWDMQLLGGCSLSPDELRTEYGNTRVMYGVDERAPGHIGLAPDGSLPIHDERPLK
jgi:hypothetical protein